MTYSLQKNLDSVREHGLERTDAEIAFIIANYCSWCPAWNPNRDAKKKCDYCSCSSTETIEHLHRRRMRNCPRRGAHATNWTEEGLRDSFDCPAESLV